MIIVALVSCQIQRHKKEAEVKETTKITQQEKEEKETVETEAQRLERVKREAKENGYPEGVIDLLGKNKETIDFVEDYGEKKDDPSADTIGNDLEAGEIPQLIQWDERWGYAPYGTSIVAVSGCGPTCLSMVAAGLNEDPSITPAKVAAYGTENSYVDENNDTYWKFMSEAGANWNLSCYEGLLSEEQVSAELTAGHPIICSVGPGDFTKIGHFIVLTGYESGNVTVNDPFSQKNSDKTWVYAEIADQIKAMWIYSLKE
ncbi:MAG: C39 family peptidase [Lachnospiraceae bacterium]|nr:C39 family peptidase [Lachnospiraceae bacterium]MDY2612522.1 C39 family peptidase [Lachnospiraceae bacterium]MDY4206772.1 C39 family peptidase [Lachnospiraceae bacterium]